MFRTVWSWVLPFFVLLAVAAEAEAQSCPTGQASVISVTSVGGYPNGPGHWCPSVAAMEVQIYAMKGFGATHAAAYQSFKADIASIPPVDLDNTCSTWAAFKPRCFDEFHPSDACRISLIYQTTGEWVYNGTVSPIGLTGPPGPCAPAYFGKKEADGENLGRCKACAEGNPINPANGNKFQEESDYRGPGQFSLSFGRFYNSQDRRAEDSMGLGWRHTFSRRIRRLTTQPAHVPGAADTTALKATPQEACAEWGKIKAQAAGLAQTVANYSGGACMLTEGGVARGAMAIYQPGQPTLSEPVIYVDREDGRSEKFTGSSSPYLPPEGVKAKLEQNGSGYRYTDENDVVEEYNSAGVLQSIKHRSGLKQTLAYVNGKLSSVTDSFGRSLQFGYTNGRLTTMTDPTGNQQYVYSYHPVTGDLEKATFPDTKFRQYHYDDSGFPGLLSRITDENEVVFATWTYDAMGRAKSSQHAGGVESVTLTFGDGTTTAQKAFGAARTQTFQSIGGAYHTATIERTCPGCTTASTSTTYDANGFPDIKTDFNDNITDYDYNSRGLEVQRIEAKNTDRQRTIVTGWHPDYRVPASVETLGSNRTTTYGYYPNTELLHTITVTDTTPVTGGTRVTAFTYEEVGPDSVLKLDTVDGPRTDIADITDYDYDAVTGDLSTITNALGQVTQITEYDAHGNPKLIIDPNGIKTKLTYDARQRLKTRIVAFETSQAATTNFDYDGVGQLDKVALPDGAYLDYDYDDAHRLTDIRDNAGNHIHYGVDALGNRTAEEIRDAAGALRRNQTQVFDALGQLDKIKNAAGQIVTDYGYDLQGNRTSQKDFTAPSTSNETTYTPDELNRIKQVTTGDGSTAYEYNALDQLVLVKDPENLETEYIINPLGDLKKLISPDTGATDYSYDAAGNRKKQIDARGVEVNYSYDALNRLIFVDYASNDEDVTYSYDGSNYAGAMPNGVGRLTGVVVGPTAAPVQSTTLIYDAHGNVIEERQSISGATYVTAYAYDLADRLTGVTYPSGRQVVYARYTTADISPGQVGKAVGQIKEVTTTVAATAGATTLASSITYMPFGGVKSYTMGNGVVVTRDYDQDYRLDVISDQGAATIQHLDLGYDLQGNVLTLDNLTAPSRNQMFGYDGLSRLTSAAASGTYGSHAYTYDEVGNRLTKTVNSSLDTYTYPNPRNSHHLLAAGGIGFDYDDAGNATTKSGIALAYNLANRLATVTGGSAEVTNAYNAAGQRVTKTVGGTTRVFHYDRLGQLIGETCADGRSISEYAYVDDHLLAMWSQPAANDPCTIPAVGSPPAIPLPLTLIQGGATPYGSDGATRALYHFDSESVLGGQVKTPDSGPHQLDGTLGGATLPTLVASPSGGLGSAYSFDGVQRGSASDQRITVPEAMDHGLAGKQQWTLDVQVMPKVLPQTQNQQMIILMRGPNGPTYPGVLNDWQLALMRTSNTGVPETETVLFRFEYWGSNTSIQGTSAQVDFGHTTWGQMRDKIFQIRVVFDRAQSVPFLFLVNGAYANSSLTAASLTPVSYSLRIGSHSRLDKPRAWGGVIDELRISDTVRNDGVVPPAAPVSTEPAVYYYHTDHLGTPQKLTDQTATVVWDAVYDPFGSASIVTGQITNNLRFPGQYFDAETGLHQNWNRDYDPSIGRYVQSDPIGLQGGLSTYAYVGNNPTRFTDPNGLEIGAAYGAVYKADQPAKVPSTAAPAPSSGISPTNPGTTVFSPPKERYNPKSPECYDTCYQEQTATCSSGTVACAVGCSLGSGGLGSAGCVIGCTVCGAAMCAQMSSNACKNVCEK